MSIYLPFYIVIQKIDCSLLFAADSWVKEDDSERVQLVNFVAYLLIQSSKYLMWNLCFVFK